MAVYRVNSNFNGLRQGTFVDINPDDWSEAIKRGRLKARPDLDHLAPPAEESEPFVWGSQ